MCFSEVAEWWGSHRPALLSQWERCSYSVALFVVLLVLSVFYVNCCFQQCFAKQPRSVFWMISHHAPFQRRTFFPHCNIEPFLISNWQEMTALTDQAQQLLLHGSTKRNIASPLSLENISAPHIISSPIFKNARRNFEIVFIEFETYWTLHCLQSPPLICEQGPSTPSSPTSPGGLRLRRPSPLTADAMERINLVSVWLKWKKSFQ